MDPDKGVGGDSWSLLFSEVGTPEAFQGLDPLCGSGRQFSGLDHPFRAQAPVDANGNPQSLASGEKDWDSRTILDNLSFLEKKIHQLQDLVHLIVGPKDYSSGDRDDIAVQQQQLITADLISIIVQLISTAGSLLPSVKHAFSSERSVGGAMDHHVENQKDVESQKDVVLQQRSSAGKAEDQSDSKGFFRSEPAEDHEMKSDDDGECLPPGSYQILQLEKEEILAPHTHFCMICGKGFKRDANLRMHMRGHGDEYKTPAALAKPNKESPHEPVLLRRYSCPYVGCKRNKDHKKFQPLKTILCVKNHYKRTHCDKTYMCSRCNSKKFSVIADLKTHEKHCGRDKWLCSCGTTFSRKDKLFGHIGLFQGHTPAILAEELKGYPANFDQRQCSEAATKVEQLEFKSNLDAIDVEGPAENSTRYASPFAFDKNSSYQDFLPRTQFEDCSSSFGFLMSGGGNYAGSGNTE